MISCGTKSLSQTEVFINIVLYWGYISLKLGLYSSFSLILVTPIMEVALLLLIEEALLWDIITCMF